jgi:hypothetical protein
MDDMRRVGVKKALVLVNFNWKGQAADIKPDRILYFDEYDSDCSQITDVERLTKIIASGLGKKLEEFVAEQTARTPWYHLEQMPQAKRGVSRMEVFDDEWLPRSSPEFWPSPLPWSPLVAAVTVHDEAQIAATLASGEISKDELDAMLIMASGKTDSCVVKMLLSAGAEVNHRNKDGLTPLMYAAGAGKIHNVEVLLAAGADRSAKSILGETAISRAQKNGHTEIAQLLKQSAN